jgi:hypothetical protein
MLRVEMQTSRHLRTTLEKLRKEKGDSDEKMERVVCAVLEDTMCPVCYHNPPELWILACGHRLCAQCVGSLYNLHGMVARGVSMACSCVDAVPRHLHDLMRLRDASIAPAKCPMCRHGLDCSKMTRIGYPVLDIKPLVDRTTDACQDCGAHMRASELAQHSAWSCRALKPCPHCGHSIERSWMHNHISYVCARMPMKCTLCAEEPVREAFDAHMITHTSTACECGAVVPHACMTAHRDSTCPVVQCVCMVCLRVVSRNRLRDHHAQYHHTAARARRTTPFDTVRTAVDDAAIHTKCRRTRPRHHQVYVAQPTTAPSPEPESIMEWAPYVGNSSDEDDADTDMLPAQHLLLPDPSIAREEWPRTAPPVSGMPPGLALEPLAIADVAADSSSDGGIDEGPGHEEPPTTPALRVSYIPAHGTSQIEGMGDAYAAYAVWSANPNRARIMSTLGIPMPPRGVARVIPPVAQGAPVIAAYPVDAAGNTQQEMQQ